MVTMAKEKKSAPKKAADKKAKASPKAAAPPAVKKTADKRAKPATPAKAPTKKAASTSAKKSIKTAATPKATPAKAAPAKAAPVVEEKPGKAAAAKAPAKAVPVAKVETKQPAKKAIEAPKPAPARAAKRPAATVTAADFRSIEDADAELPLEYGDTKVVLLTRDPEWIFVYWEISASTRKKFGLDRGNHRKALALRLFELRDGADINAAEKHYDVPVNDYTSSWYLRVPVANANFRVQLGTFKDGGEFLPIATSNEIRSPRMTISEETDVEFAEINDEIYNQIVHLSGGVRIRERLGSDEFLRSLQQRVFETLAAGPFSSGAGQSSGSVYGLSSGALLGLSSGQFGLSSGMFSSGDILNLNLSSGAFPSSLFGATMSGAGGEEGNLSRPGDKKREFWLEVGVDVIVYGATEPDAKVKFMGQDIRLTPDGTFRVRMVLPDTTIEFPIEAVSADGEETRRVKPVVKRHTQGDPHKPV